MCNDNQFLVQVRIYQVCMIYREHAELEKRWANPMSDLPEL